MIVGVVKGRSLAVYGVDYITSGSVGLPIRFAFDGEWSGFSKSAVFEAGGIKKTVLLQNDECDIPWEVLKNHGIPLRIGVHGTNGSTKVIPTIWCELTIHHGTEVNGDIPVGFTPSIVDQIEAHLASIEEDVEEVKEYRIGENIIYNGMPHIGFTSMGNTSITGWLGARASTSVDAEGLSGKYFNIKYPVGVTSDQGLFQFQKYMIRNGEEGNGSEINIINSGDTVSVGFEINTNVSLEHIYFRTACSVYNGTTPSIVYCVNAESDVTNDKWVHFEGSCVMPDWWDSMKTSADTKHLGFILEIKPGSDLDGTVEKSVKIRNIKLEFGETPTSFIPSIMDFSDISSKAYTLPLEKGSGNKSVQVINTDNENNASGVASFAGGGRSTASGQMSIAFGSYSSSYPTGPVASGAASIALGLASRATGNYAVAAGQVAEASGGSSVAMGYHTVASGSRSVAMGQNTEANANSAAAFGNLTKATGRTSFVIGQANIEDTNPVDTTHGSEARKYLFTIGNGTDDTHRSNALTVDWNGNEELAGSLTLGKGTANEITITAQQLRALLNLLN